ncbi:MAG: thioredoxin domain-containing protein [Leptospiraceae bacterium]|nr:thioredoxin domain-containing protein [Leptospiraceae bacterium]
MKNSKNLFIVGLIFGIVGVIVSFLLIREYYGNAGEFVSSLCSATGDPGSCEKVKNSDFSGFNFPVLGKIPVALFGFLFYGLVSVLNFFGMKETDDNKKQNYLSTILGFAILAFIIDMVLFAISLFVIGAVCSLCFVTYIATLLVLIISYMNLKTIDSNKGVFSNMGEKFLPSFTSNFLTYTIIVLVFFGCGLFMGRYQGGGNTIASSPDMLKAQIEAFEKKQPFDLKTDGVPFAGDPNSPIVIVKYHDYNCGHCAHTSHILHQILAEFQGLVKVYYKDFPLDGNCNRLVGRKTPDASSCIAAAASYCGFKQNKFYPVYTGIFMDAEQGVRHSVSSVKSVAEKVGLNMSQFQACVSSPSTAAFINSEVDESEKLNIQSTPSVYVNGKPLDPGTPNEKFLRELIIHLSKKI